MKVETLTALKGSIAKWKAIAAGTGVDRGVKNCPLCMLFYSDDQTYIENCKGCPVKSKVRETLCSKTPYIAWHDSHPYMRFPLEAKTEKHKKLARAELKFLRSLLPKKKVA